MCVHIYKKKRNVSDNIRCINIIIIDLYSARAKSTIRSLTFGLWAVYCTRWPVFNALLTLPICPRLFISLPKYHTKNTIVRCYRTVFFFNDSRPGPFQERFAPIPTCYSSNLKKLVDDLLQKDPLRRPSANDLVEIVPDFIEFITNSDLVDGNGEFESSCDDDLLNRCASYNRNNVVIVFLSSVLFFFLPLRLDR